MLERVAGPQLAEEQYLYEAIAAGGARPNGSEVRLQFAELSPWLAARRLALVPTAVETDAQMLGLEVRSSLMLAMPGMERILPEDMTLIAVAMSDWQALEDCRPVLDCIR